jgi:lipoyl(octanoyl) transferase
LSHSNNLTIKVFAEEQTYQPIWQAMQHFTEQRTTETADEIWLLQHQPVFTLGRNGDRAHIINQSSIPIIPIDRGGQVTYHGPGQLIAYLMIDLKRRLLGVRQFVTLIENSIIDTLGEYQLIAQANPKAPGVYINGGKIAALGLRIKKSCSFHGLSLNLSMDITPFKQINPCGYKNLEVIQLSDYIGKVKFSQVQQQLIQHLATHLGQQRHYDQVLWQYDISSVPY